MLFGAHSYVKMEEAGGGEGASGGAGGGAGGAGAGAGSAGAAGGSGAAGAGAGSGAGASSWHGYTAPEDVAYVANKGWQGVGDVLKSYRGAEKLIGKNPDSLVEIPRADDPDGWRALDARLGMPANAKDYKFDAPQDLPLDEGYQEFARNAFHQIGLRGDQAAKLTKAHNDYIRGVLKEHQANYDRNLATDKAALLKEWGGGAERMMNMAKTAANALGFSNEVIDAIETQIGYGATMRLFAGLGMKMSEDGFAGGQGNQGGARFSDTMTPAEAKAQWDAMRLDQNQAKALLDPAHPGHKVAKEKQSKLFSIMYPG